MRHAADAGERAARAVWVRGRQAGDVEAGGQEGEGADAGVLGGEFLVDEALGFVFGYLSLDT